MFRSIRALVATALVVSAVRPMAAQQTVPERTGGERTSSHADVLAFIDSLARRGAPIRVATLGESPQGRRLPYVVMARPMVHDPVEARRSGKPVFYIQGNIHAGEVEGKEAVQALMRDLGVGPLQKLLDSVVVLWVPMYNADGNDAFGPGDRNRGGQNGPAIVGLRANGQGLDLNRDYVKQEAPETRAALALVAAWDPDVFMDLHTTNGSYHGYGLTWAPGLNANATPANRWVQDKALEEIRSRLRKRTKIETYPYGNFRNQHPDSLKLGWDTYEPYPRYGINLMGITRLAILSEAYSNDPLPKRIESTYQFVLETLRYMVEKREDVRRLMAETIALRPDSVVVRSTFAPPRMDSVIAELTSGGAAGAGGFARRQRTGEMRKVWMPVVDRFQATRREKVPAAYLLDAQWGEVADLLARQGVVVERLTAPWSGQSQRFVPDSVIYATRPFEGHRATRLEGSWGAAAADSLPAGGYLIATDQRYGLLAALLLEPASEDGYTTWNLFDRALRVRGAHPVRKVATVPAVPRVRVP